MRSKAQAILRQEEMLKMLDGGATVSVRTFSERLKCSYATVRNDLAYLEKQGLVLRTHGGAIRTESAPVIGLRRREVANPGAKRDIARVAFESCVREDMTLILDSGTTNVELARVIATSGLPLTVLTHSAPVLRILSEAHGIRLFAFGGNYHANSEAFYDGNLRIFAETMHADVYFMGFNGLLPDQGFAHAALFEQETKKLYMAMASRTVAVGDAAKLNRGGLWIAGSFAEVHALVTDSRIPEDLAERLREAGLELLIAEYKNE